MAPVPEAARAEQPPATAERQLHVALDNMPGALVYTDDDLKIVFCNERFREMYLVPRELLQARPAVSRFPALSGRARLLRRRRRGRAGRQADREPAQPDRPRASRTTRPTAAGTASCAAASAAGGTVTVMTDITEQKQAEQDLADKEAQLQVALDNMPGALVYTDENLNIVVCNDRFKEMYIVPAGAAAAGPPVSRSSCAISPTTATTERATSRRWSPSASRACAILRARASRTTRRTAAGIAFCRRRVAAGGTVTVMTDITEQKQAERDLLEAKQRTDEANKLITEKNRVLEALYREIQDKNRQVEEQAAQIAEWNARLETRVAEQVAQIGQISKLTRFLSPKVSDLIMSGDADDPLKTRRREITVVFVDLRGFTGFTETAEPEEVMSVLREYHAELGRAIIAYDGTIEHFAGDGVMILFNDPVPVEDHELQAIRMALRMRDSMAASLKAGASAAHVLGFGVGIAGGYATIGTIGFEGRLDYGAIGTVTNLAARLCGEAGDGQILISPRIFSNVETAIDARSGRRADAEGLPKAGRHARRARPAAGRQGVAFVWGTSDPHGLRP